MLAKIIERAVAMKAGRTPDAERSLAPAAAKGAASRPRSAKAEATKRKTPTRPAKKARAR
jgi:hypothetical protein